MNIENEFIPYEQALELKELGFDESCICRYCIVTKWEEPTGEILLQLSDCELSEKNLVKAPLYQQVFRWFREKYDLIACNDYGNNKYFYWIISKDEKFFFDNEDGNRNCIVYNTYEKAELECLKKLIEIVKEKGL
jgi:hypothetical protein